MYAEGQVEIRRVWQSGTAAEKAALRARWTVLDRRSLSLTDVFSQYAMGPDRTALWLARRRKQRVLLPARATELALGACIADAADKVPQPPLKRPRYRERALQRVKDLTRQQG